MLTEQHLEPTLGPRSTPVTNLDIAPTILDMVGLTAAYPLDGVSLRPSTTP